MQEELYLKNSAIDSPKDNRTVKEKTYISDMFSFPSAGGKMIAQEKILDQNRVGICTAISHIQILWEKTGVRYSEDFLYGLQKHFLDREAFTNMPEWFEGSATFHSVKAGYKYGYLRKEIFDKYFQRDPNENYFAYSTRLKTIFNKTNLLNELLAQCEKPMQGYTVISPINTNTLSRAIADVDNAVLARFTCGWSWFYKELPNGIIKNYFEDNSIEPIIEPVVRGNFPITGHAVSLPANTETELIVGNTWNNKWTGDGHAVINYLPTEAYKLYFKNFEDKWKLPIKKAEFKHNFNVQLRLGSSNRYEIELMQYALIFEECMDWIPPAQRGYFGLKTLAGVRKFQSKYGITSTGFVGPITLKKLNELYNK